MSNLFIRISCSFEEFSVVLSHIENDLQAGAIYEHKGARVHIHAYLKGYSRTTQHLKNLITRHVRQMARTDWSFKTAYDDHSITYMSKGNIEASWYKGFTQQEIDTYRDSWKEPVGSTENSKTSHYQSKLQFITRESPSEAKKRKNDLIKEMLVELNDTTPTTTNLSYYVEENTIRIIVKVLNANNVIFGRYTVRDYYDTICARAMTESFVSSMIKFCQGKV